MSTQSSDQALNEIVSRVVRRALGEQAGPEAVVPATTAGSRQVAIGADHGGFALKEKIRGWLEQWGYAVFDCGVFNTEAADYPDLAEAVARRISNGQAWRGILVDGAGIGSCIAANKLMGVRAALCYNHATAINAREHNDSNVLTLGSGMLGDNLVRGIVQVWLETEFAGGRHALRVDKIEAIEKRYGLRKPESNA